MKMSDSFKLSSCQAVKKSGIDICFGIVGGEAEAIHFSDKTDYPRFILTRHEFTASVAADVWGRLTGRPAEARKPFLIEIPTIYSYGMRRHMA